MKLKTDFRWPKRGDNPFFAGLPEPNSPTWVSLDWLRTWNINDSFLAEGYKEAADKIISDLQRGINVKHPDIYFMPITFLYRHSLELKMKQIIILAIRLDLIQRVEKLDKVLKDHNLCNLWNYVKKAILKIWPDGSKQDISSVERIIQSFHNLDKSGQNLRYAKDSLGCSTLDKLPNSLQLTQLQDVFQAIWNFLDGCEAGIDETIKNSNW